MPKKIKNIELISKKIEKDKKETNRETDKVRVKKSEKHKINLEKDRKKLTEKLLK